MRNLCAEQAAGTILLTGRAATAARIRSKQQLLHGGQQADQSASVSVSPVRMRLACSIGVTKILPSPIWPVRAPELMTSTALTASSDDTAISIRSFGRKFTMYSAPR